VNEQDSLALVDLYNSTDGEHWKYNYNWLTENPVSTWFGITVSDTRVTSIFLYGDRLNGTIPSSLGNLKNLKEIIFDYNRLSGFIPSSLGNLINLTRLDLSSNKLSGSIPPSLGNLINIYFLDLSHNDLNGRIPSSVGNLTNLNYLRFNNNHLSSSIPSSLGNLVNLTELTLSYNKFTFDGMELIQQKFDDNVYYDPQKRIPLHKNVNTLSVSAGGTLSDNTYYWGKIVNASVRPIKTIIGDSVFHPAKSGDYVVKVTNSVATQLTLYSDIINYSIPGGSNNSIAENSSQQYNNTSLLIVYPNPAKDILHIQTNSAASFSLINQLGKILLTTNINGSGTIEVPGVADGLYYLKNNSNGTTQKVVIEK